MLQIKNTKMAKANTKTTQNAKPMLNKYTNNEI